ncbi:cohesin domain-containing protein [Halovivax limisalsi]|uniref:cohesin domain-containing protein n=1 Tax=Halovivax limisalsi TaxID=1453760 RepID=UPI001FFD1403|nr:cohesin domain-containing protein [Halovivax limisalsi]
MDVVLVVTIALVGIGLIVPAAGAVDVRELSADEPIDGTGDSTENAFSLVAGEQDGDQITVTARTNATDVAGYGAEVTFDPDIVEVESVSGVDMSDPVTNIDNANGSVFFTQSQASGIDSPELAAITFNVLAAGETELAFVERETTMNDGQSPPEPIPFEPVGTTISVEGDGGEEPPENTFSLEAGQQDGDQVTVTARTNATDVAGYGANVTFDPDIVEVASVSGVDMSDPTTNVNNEDGWVFFTQSQASGIDAPELAEITFDVAATGETELSFVGADTTLNDGQSPPEPIPFEPVGTTISVEDEGDDESPTETLSLVAGEQDGERIPVTLETTVANTAGYQANVTFDPGVVEVASVSGVDMADPVTNVDNESGWVSITQSQATGVDAPTLATIAFDVVEAGETDLEFVEADSLVNNESERVPVDYNGTTVSVEEDSDDGGGGPTLPPPTPDPAEFEFEIQKAPVSTLTVGESIEVPVAVTNVGEEAGEYELTLANESAAIVTETVSLDGGASTTVTFEHTFESAGTYALSLNDESLGSIEVTESTDRSDESDDRSDEGDDGASDGDQSDGGDDGADGADATGPDTGSGDSIPGFGVVAGVTAVLAFALVTRRR